MWTNLGGRGPVNLDTLGQSFAPPPNNPDLNAQICLQQLRNASNTNPAARRTHRASVHPSRVVPAQVYQAQVNPAQVIPAQVNPAQVNPLQVNPAQLNPA